MTLSAALLEDWIFGAFLCKLVNFTPTLTALVSTFTVAIIAVERWFFIVNKRKFDRRCTIVTLILLWIVSILIALPEFISRHIQEYAPPSSYSMNQIINNNTDLSAMHTMKTPCHMKKIYFCVLDTGLRMRIFSYIVIIVQYLVPFLFVSVSCYSISRYLKRRMKQMRIYQTHRPASIKKPNDKRPKKPKLRRASSNLDEITEHEFTSCDDLPVGIVQNENKALHLFTRFRNSFRNREHYQDSIILEKQNDDQSASIVGTILMATPKTRSHSERRFHRSKKLLICVAALFTISWLPLTIVQIYLEHKEETTNSDPNFAYAFLLIPCYLISSLSAWMNPVIYNYINRSFRREFYALYPCCKLTAASSTVSLKTEIPSVITKRSERQQLKDIEDNTGFLPPCKTNNSTARFVTFADTGKKGKASIVVINEHI